MALRLMDLPESEVIKRDLEKDLFIPPPPNKSPSRTPAKASAENYPKVTAVDILQKAAIAQPRRSSDFVKRIQNRRITRVVRRGRMLFLLMEHGSSADEVLAIDFGSGGLLRRNTRSEDILPDTAVIISLGSWGQLRLRDTKVGVQMYVTKRQELTSSSALLKGLGMDPLSQPITWQEFHSICQGSGSKSLKSLLLDESIVVGIGDIYSDEILFHSELHYQRRADSLTPTEIRRLCRAMSSTLHEAAKYRGTTLPKRTFADLEGQAGGYQSYLEVYQRDGELSSRGGTIVKNRFSGRQTYFCEKTQLLEELE